jgi:hypothetical protein
MNNFQSFLVAASIVLIAFAPVTCSMNTNRTIESMVKSGADPADAKCAVAATYNHDICAIRATTKNKKSPE